MPQICLFTAQHYLQRYNSSSQLSLAPFCTFTAGLGRTLAISGSVTHSLPGRSRITRVETHATRTQSLTSAPPVGWRHALPTFTGRLVTLRQIEVSDARALLETMASDAVARFISTPPHGLDEFERFIDRMRDEQRRGNYACFAVVPTGETQAAGLFQVHSLEPGFVKAVIQAESAFNPFARSVKGAMGLMQLMPSTAAQYKVANAYDPAENIRAGVAYLKSLLTRFNNDVSLALAAYNAGPGAVEKYGNSVPPYKETRSYVSKIRKNAGVDNPVRASNNLYRVVEVVDGRETVHYYNKPRPGATIVR